MPLIPNFIEREILLRFRLAPALMLDYVGAVAFRSACAALRLGVFDALQSESRTATEVAHYIDADLRGTRILLDTLVAVDYLRKKGDHYVLTKSTAKWLPRLRDGLPFFEMMTFEGLDSLEETVRRGVPDSPIYEWLQAMPERWPKFQAGMLSLSHLMAPQLVRKVTLPADARRLIDIGGCHGFYATEFCRCHPNLSATVLDVAVTGDMARKTIDSSGMIGRVEFKEGDFLEDDLGNGYHVALMVNIVHGFSPEQNRTLLHKVASCLEPGGMVVILDQLLDSGTFGRLASAIARLNSLNLFNSVGGECYSSKEITSWLSQAGFGSVRRINLLTAPGNGAVIGIKTPT